MEYNIVPDPCDYKNFPILAIVGQFAALGFVLLSYFESLILILACIYEVISLLYVGLFICQKHYRLNITANHLTVYCIFNKTKKYPVREVWWRIQRIPWYNSFYILLYSSGKVPVAIIKPHWTNAIKIMHFSHLGEMTSVEREYLKFMKSVNPWH